MIKWIFENILYLENFGIKIFYFCKFKENFILKIINKVKYNKYVSYLYQICY